jgi:hypothetical protein
MMRRAFILSLAFVATGCAPRSFLQVDAFMAGYAAGRASMQASDEAAVDAQVETPVDEDPPAEWVEDVPTTPTKVNLQPLVAAPAPTPFDSSVAYAAIGRADLAACKPAPGYVRASVSYAPDGTASGVSLALPPGSTPASRICVDAALRATHIPSFSGTAPVTVHRAVYVTTAPT